MLSSGSSGSAAEHAIFEQLDQLPSVSTIKLLVLANRQGIPVFTVDRSNLAQILPQLDTFPIVKENISDFVNSGFIAVVPQRNQRFFNWLGTGWIVFDPNTGSAGYFIAGSLVLGGAATAGGSSGVAFAFDDSSARATVIAARDLVEAGQMFKEGAELTAAGELLAQLATGTRAHSSACGLLRVDRTGCIAPTPDEL